MCFLEENVQKDAKKYEIFESAVYMKIWEYAFMQSYFQA